MKFLKIIVGVVIVFMMLNLSANAQTIVVKGRITYFEKARNVGGVSINLAKDQVVYKRVKSHGPYFIIDFEPEDNFTLQFEKKGFVFPEINLDLNDLPDADTLEITLIVSGVKEKDNIPVDNEQVTVKYSSDDKSLIVSESQYVYRTEEYIFIWDVDRIDEEINNMINYYSEASNKYFEDSGDYVFEMIKAEFSNEQDVVVNNDMDSITRLEMSLFNEDEPLDSMFNKIIKIKDTISTGMKYYFQQVKPDKNKNETPELKVQKYQAKLQLDSLIDLKVDSLIEIQYVVYDSISKKDKSKQFEEKELKKIVQSKEQIEAAKRLLKTKEENAETPEELMAIQKKYNELLEVEQKFAVELQNMQKQYEVEKMEREKQEKINEAQQREYEAQQQVLNLEKQKTEEQDEKIKAQRITLIVALSGLGLFILMFVLLLKEYKAKRRKNFLLEEKNKRILQQNTEIEAQRDEIEAQRDEISAQRDMVLEQKEEIENIHHELTDSIEYAEKIQKAMLIGVLVLEENSLESFIYYKPRDIVSGDFYYINKINNWLIFCVADCTGHGVPGGFMSMMGMAYLNEIVNKKEITTAAQVLEELRTKVMNALHQRADDDNYEVVKDGMDISFCAYNTFDNQLQYAGANNPLYIITKQTNYDAGPIRIHEIETVQEYKLLEIKADKMPIGIYDNMKPFKNHYVSLAEGDQLYLFSDGYIDQFGGRRGRKYLSKNFKDLLLKNTELSFAKKKEILEQEYSKWVSMNKEEYGGDYEQIDDICILGLRLD
jgi:serine phosphatase RsbU (regulator of sigma subunit)